MNVFFLVISRHIGSDTFFDLFFVIGKWINVAPCSWPFLFMSSSSSFTNVSSLILLYNLAETTEGTEGNQEEFKDAKEKAIDKEKAG